MYDVTNLLLSACIANILTMDHLNRDLDCFWLQFALHSNARGWTCLSEFVTYALGQEELDFYDGYNLLLFSDASPVFSADATSSKCHITPSRPEEAHRTLDVICTYFRSFKYTCSDGNAFTLKIPKLEMPRNAVYVRTCALLDNTLLYGGPVHSFVISMLYFQHSCSQQNLLHFSATLRKRDLAVDTCIPANARRFQDLFVLRLLYPELESSLSSLNFGAFVHYRRFSQRANVLKFCARHFSEQVVWWSPSQTWVPEMYLWDYRYYLVRRTTLIRAMRNFVRKYADSIHNLLWTPPNGIMVQKGWKSCVAMMEETERDS